MFPNRTRILWISLLCLLLTLAALPAAADYDPNAILPRPTNPPEATLDVDGYLIVDTDNLFMRSGDGAEYTPLAILDGGTRLVVLGNNGLRNANRWWYVEVGDMRGWVSNNYVVVRGDLTNSPRVPADGEITPPALYVGGVNRVYSRPHRVRPLCTIQHNRFYIVTGRDAEAESWYQIEATCGGETVLGWIEADRGLLRNSGGVNIPIISD